MSSQETTDRNLDNEWQKFLKNKDHKVTLPKVIKKRSSKFVSEKQQRGIKHGI